MTALVTIETLLLALLTLLVVGLLRSHAEILRRLEALDPAGRPPSPADAPGGLPEARRQQTPVFDVAGTTVAGDQIKVAVRGTGTPTMLAFLSSGCVPCVPFWSGLSAGAGQRLPGGARIVVVTKDAAFESSSRLAELAPSRVPVVMSSDAWDAYAVRGSPYFIHVDGSTDRVLGEGTAEDWSQVASLVQDARADAEVAAARGSGDSTSDRLRRAERELEAAGIRPGDPSLYGGRPGTQPDEAKGSDR